jgi:hypothetical protein
MGARRIEGIEPNTLDDGCLQLRGVGATRNAGFHVVLEARRRPGVGLAHEQQPACQHDNPCDRRHAAGIACHLGLAEAAEQGVIQTRCWLTGGKCPGRSGGDRTGGAQLQLENPAKNIQIALTSQMRGIYRKSTRIFARANA